MKEQEPPRHAAPPPPGVINAMYEPGEFYRRAYSKDDLEKKSPVDVPEEADVMVDVKKPEQPPPQQAKK